MQVRTTRSTVRFTSAFRLAGMDAPQPGGEYGIECDDELIEGPTFRAYRRRATFIHLPAIDVRSTTSEMLEIDAADLEAALAKDGQSA
jgi:hypothetical protein